METKVYTRQDNYSATLPLLSHPSCRLSVLNGDSSPISLATCYYTTKESNKMV